MIPWLKRKVTMVNNSEEKETFSGAVTGDAGGGYGDTSDATNATHGHENGVSGVPVIDNPDDFRPMPPWMPVALKEIGVREIVGSQHNTRVLQYHATTTLKASQDEVPWCSSFVNWVLARAQMERTDSAAAKSWLDWGYALDKPIYGAIVVLSRAGGNHVGFFIDVNEKGDWVLLGGNQNNAVNESAYPADRVLSVRWPEGFAPRDFRLRK